MNIIRQHVAAQDSRKVIMMILGGLVCMCLVAYVALVNMAVHNAVAYEDMKKESALLRSEVAELEMKQIKLRQAITVGTARSLGFVELSNPHFVSIAAPSISLKH